MAKKRLKLAELLLERGLANDNRQAHALILAGQVSVAGHPHPKAGLTLPIDVEITVRHSATTVGRGSEKLRAALGAFEVSPKDQVCADLGASTGGFTQLLLERGARRVYAIDTAYGELAWSLRQDERVVVLDRTNIMHLPPFPELISFVTIDLSFTPLAKALVNIAPHCDTLAPIIALLKPQYEASDRTSGGVISSVVERHEVVAKTLHGLQASGFAIKGLICSPITGMGGNQEYLVWCEIGNGKAVNYDTLISDSSEGELTIEDRVALLSR